MIEIALSKLGTKELFTLGSRITEGISNYDTKALGIKMYADNFESKFDKYRVSFEKQHVSAELISIKDESRDDYYIALRNHIRNFQYHPSLDVKDKAKKLMSVLNKNGNQIYSSSYKAETAALSVIFTEIDKNHVATIKELGSDVWYNLLKQSQTDFEKTVHEHSGEKAEASKIESATTNRAELVDAINKLFMFLPLHNEMKQNADLSKLIGQLQAEADRF